MKTFLSCLSLMFLAGCATNSSGQAFSKASGRVPASYKDEAVIDCVNQWVMSEGDTIDPERPFLSYVTPPAALSSRGLPQIVKCVSAKGYEYSQRTEWAAPNKLADVTLMQFYVLFGGHVRQR